MRQARASAAARAASEKCFERMSGPQFGGRQRKARHAGAAVSSLSWITETIPPGQAPRQLRATKTPNSIRIALVVGRRNIADAAEPAREICAVSGTGRAPCAASGISAPEATRIATFPRPPRIRARRSRPRAPYSGAGPVIPPDSRRRHRPCARVSPMQPRGHSSHRRGHRWLPCPRLRIHALQEIGPLSALRRVSACATGPRPRASAAFTTQTDSETVRNRQCIFGPPPRPHRAFILATTIRTR
jgi:hypothetical protein